MHLLKVLTVLHARRSNACLLRLLLLLLLLLTSVAS
jgi:hypothetical protein